MKVFRSVLLCLFVGGSLAAQSTVRQGTPDDQSKYQFTSPMVVEIPMTELVGAEKWSGIVLTDQAKYICDDVSIVSIHFSTTTKSSGKITKLWMEPNVFVRPSHDRLVNLRFTFVSNGKELDPSAECIIAAKEKKKRHGNSQIELPTDQFNEMRSPGSSATLKIVVSVKED